MLEPILEGHADVVFGNRFHGGPHRVLYFWHYVGNRLLTLAANVVTGLNPSDMEVGYKVFRADVLRRLTLTSNRFGFEPEITVKVAPMTIALRMSLSLRETQGGLLSLWSDFSGRTTRLTILSTQAII